MGRIAAIIADPLFDGSNEKAEYNTSQQADDRHQGSSGFFHENPSLIEVLL